MLVLAVALLALGHPAPRPGRGAGECRRGTSQAGEWRSLFDGRTLAGWHNPYDWGEAWAEGGELRLRGAKKFFLVANERFRDFVLEAEVMLPDAASNSGIQFRSHVEKNRVYGYQAEVDPSPRQWSGGLYDEGRREWLTPVRGDTASERAFRARAGSAFKPAGWNRYRIEARGDSLKIFVNGRLTTAYRDTLDRDGYVAVQHHGEAGKVYRFRNIRVRVLSPPSSPSPPSP